MPFYVSPEQVLADKAEYARKGIARGKSLVALEYVAGVLLIAENATKLAKIGEIYDRIAFAGVGKFSEFDRLRRDGVRFADTKGYAYSRDDVRAKGLANAYSQFMTEVFTREMKPYEVDVIVAEVGDDRYVGHEQNALYRVGYDGFISDHTGFCVIGGNVDDVERGLKDEYREGLAVEQAVSIARRALSRGADGNIGLDAASLEVCLLERGRPGRHFRRLLQSDVESMLTD